MSDSIVLREILSTLDEWFPPFLAEDWDNVGLLLGDRESSVASIMTCLTLTTESAEEAIAQKANLIVSHHPILFRPIQRLTADGAEAPIFRLASAGVAIYSPHTCFDGAKEGINEQIARRLGLEGVRPLRPFDHQNPLVGAGRFGEYTSAVALADVAARTRTALAVRRVDYVGDANRPCRKVAIGCGAGAEFLADAAAAGCDVLVTGEARFHQLLEAESLGVAMVLAGHYATERFAVETLAVRLAQAFPSMQVWASRCERDPLRSLDG